jgi:predicted MFS family arabinose efflux permease
MGQLMRRFLRVFAMRDDLSRALIATMFFGAAGGIIISILNNYLSEVHALDASARGWLEFPRELPGFLILFIAGAMLTVMRETKMGAIAMMVTAIGGLGLAWWAPNITWLVVFIIIWSLGDHIIFAVEGPIGLKLAKKGGEGRRLGHFGGFRNLGTIVGVGVIYLLSKWIGPRYDVFFTLMAIAALLAGILYLTLKIGKEDRPSRRLVYRKKYSIFYAISALFGIRKQIFFAFGTWVLVALHDVPLSTIALLYFISASVGVVLRPLLGDIIDWLGERVVLAADEILLILVCMSYAFASDLFAGNVALYVLYGAYILDNLLFALRIARTTYLQKIAEDPSHITPTISMGITIDHIVAMSLPVLSGYIWEAYGYRWVFILAAGIALVGFFVCLQIRVPKELPQTSAAG